MDKVAEAPAAVEVNLLRGSAIRVSDKLQQAVGGLPIDFKGKPFVVDPYNADIRDTSPARVEGFRFWGSLEGRFRWTSPGMPVAIIKDFRMPQELRGRGAGKQLLAEWEKAAMEEGVSDFAATNIKDEAALRFWTGQGYTVPVDQQHKVIPYCVVKKVRI